MLNRQRARSEEVNKGCLNVGTKREETGDRFNKKLKIVEEIRLLMHRLCNSFHALFEVKKRI